MSYKVFVEKREGRPWQGDYWHDQILGEEIRLCPLQTIHDPLLRLLPKEGKILEAGCGQGRWVVYLHQKGYKTIGLEIYEDALKGTKKEFPSLPLIRGDVLRLPHPENSISAIISLGVVEHFEMGSEEALREMYRILRPGGLLFLTVPYESILRRWVHRPYHHAVTLIKQQRGKSFVFGEYRYNRKEMKEFLQQVGFKILETHPDDFCFPKSLGFYTDWTRYVAKKGKKWELNGFGNVLTRLLQRISPWAYPSGILFIARKDIKNF